MKSKDPWIQVKALISYWFHLLNPLWAWREGDKKNKGYKRIFKPWEDFDEEGEEAAT